MNPIRKENIAEVVEKNGYELFDMLQSYFPLKSGDMSPEQVLELEAIQKRLTNLAYAYCKNNK